MENIVQQFRGQNIRIAEVDGEFHFVLSDVCAALGIKQPVRVASRLEADEKGIAVVATRGGPQRLLTVNESGLYAVILRSDKPEATEFRKWVTSELLPAVRRGAIALDTGKPASLAQRLPVTGDLEAISQKLRSKDSKQIATAIEQAFDTIVYQTVEEMREREMLFIPPYARFQALYIGYSESLEAWKIGISQNVAKREKSINAALSGLGFDSDFVMIDHVLLPDATARALEKVAKNQDLAHLRVRNSEWFGGSETALDWFSGACALGRHQHRKWLEAQSLADHKARVPSAPVFGSFSAEFAELKRLEGLAKASVAWTQVKPLAAYEGPRVLEMNA